jgi:hypothetical protein
MPNELLQAVKAKVSPTSVPPVSSAAIAEAEIRLGFNLPVLLRELYQCVGNGRFGPGYGLSEPPILELAYRSFAHLRLGMQHTILSGLHELPESSAHL